jgi:hypothetical protein
LVSAYTEKLRDKYGVTWNYDSLELIFNALPPDRSLDNAQTRDTEVYPLLYFEAEDLEKPVVSYRAAPSPSRISPICTTARRSTTAPAARCVWVVFAASSRSM